MNSAKSVFGEDTVRIVHDLFQANTDAETKRKLNQLYEDNNAADFSNIVFNQMKRALGLSATLATSPPLTHPQQNDNKTPQGIPNEVEMTNQDKTGINILDSSNKATAGKSDNTLIAKVPLKDIQKELEDFKKEMNLTDKECSAKLEKLPGSGQQLTITFTNPEHAEMFIQLLNVN